MCISLTKMWHMKTVYILYFSSLHMQAGKAEDPHSKPFQSKCSIYALPDLPSYRISREHLGEDHDSSSPPVRSSLNNFNKIEW